MLLMPYSSLSLFFFILSLFLCHSHSDHFFHQASLQRTNFFFKIQRFSKMNDEPKICLRTYYITVIISSWINFQLSIQSWKKFLLRLLLVIELNWIRLIVSCRVYTANLFVLYLPVTCIMCISRRWWYESIYYYYIIQYSMYVSFYLSLSLSLSL